MPELNQDHASNEEEADDFDIAYKKNKKVYCKYCYSKNHIYPVDIIWACCNCDYGLAERSLHLSKGDITKIKQRRMN